MFKHGEIYYFTEDKDYWLCIHDYEEGDKNVFGRNSDQLGLEGVYFKNSPRFKHDDIIIVHERIYNPEYSDLVKLYNENKLIPIAILSEEEFNRFIEADREFYSKRATETA